MRKLALILLVIVFCLSAHSCFAQMDKQGNPVLEPSASHNVVALRGQDVEGLRLLQDVLMKLKYFYYKEIDLSECIPQILKNGISECTDRYTYYLDPEKSEQEKSELIRGEIAGIGATLEINKNGVGVKILDVTEDSPAQKSGLRAGDVIVAVSSDVAKSSGTWSAIEKMPLDKAVNMIRGPKGTSVGLQVARGDELLEFVIVRDIVKIKFLTSKVLKEGIGLIRIGAFGGEVYIQFYSALESLQKQNVKSVIIDIRNNGGGSLNSVLHMSALFAEKKECATILFVKGRDDPFKDLSICGRVVGKFNDLKVIVLQNEYSASASEILSGYLQSDAEALVIGEKSFGKGVVQSILTLHNGGALHVTTSEYFIGKKMVKVQDVGITPQIKITNLKESKSEATDAQLQRAIKEAEALLK